ncbi:MAG: MFS transporter [Pseudomonadota bacterium]
MSSQMSKWHGAGVALVCGALILLISLGVRHAFGLFLQPVSMEQGWGRETFAFAIAIQNLVWGASQPFAGMVADRYGAKPVVALGALLYGAGVWSMSVVGGEAAFVLGAGVLIGLGLSGTTFPVIFGAISRLVAPEQRSMAMGITMAVGSFGQFALLPISLSLIVGLDWQGALVALSVLAFLMLPLGFGIRSVPAPVATADEDVSFTQALRDAFAERDFWLLSLGFFACGFQVVFIAVHLPAYLADEGIGSGVATTVLALIGLFNIAGAYLAGLLGGKHRKPMLLSWIYLARGLLIAAFVVFPLSPATAYLFGATMGLFWLSTVPLTNGTVAAVFGLKHMSMLAGIVFFAHQLGSFAGGWLGGWLYDRTGSYDLAWGIAVGLSLVAAILNWPITERSLNERRAMA